MRLLRKDPGFAALAVLSLALGIGVNTAIFSIVQSVLLRPLSFPDSERLFAVWTKAKDQGAGAAGTSMPEFEDYQIQSRSFDYLANLLPNFHYTWTGNLSSIRVPLLYDVLGLDIPFFLFQTFFGLVTRVIWRHPWEFSFIGSGLYGDDLNRQSKGSRNIHQEPGYAATATLPVFER